MERKRRIVPPVYLLLALVLMWLLQRYFPLFQYVSPPVAYFGLIPIFAGITVMAASAGMFVKAGTALEPFEEATALVTRGFYRYSRNPIYLGMFLMLLGVAFLMGSIGAFLPVPVFIWIIRYNFVSGEERFMEATFGQRYLDYKSEVRRWI